MGRSSTVMEEIPQVGHSCAHRNLSSDTVLANDKHSGCTGSECGSQLTKEKQKSPKQLHFVFDLQTKITIKV